MRLMLYSELDLDTVLFISSRLDVPRSQAFGFKGLASFSVGMACCTHVSISRTVMHLDVLNSDTRVSNVTLHSCLLQCHCALFSLLPSAVLCPCLLVNFRPGCEAAVGRLQMARLGDATRSVVLQTSLHMQQTAVCSQVHLKYMSGTLQVYVR